MTKTATTQPAEQPADDDAQAQADFDAGAAMEGAPGPQTAAQPEGQQPRDEAGRFAAPKPEPKQKPESKPAAQPEYVQLTKQQFERLEAAAKRTDDFDKQFSKAFGSIGDVQKIVKTLQTQTPRGSAVKIPPGALDAMKKDFPELADHMQAVLEATLKGVEGTGSSTAQVDPAEFERQVERGVVRLQFEDLDDSIPDWRKIVGAVDVGKGEKPDPNNAFRKWLATKDKAYQDRINGTNSAGVITRAIRLFKSETKTAPAPAAPAPAPKPNPKAQARANRIQEAVRPRGDGGHPPGRNADDDFEAGFATG